LFPGDLFASSPQAPFSEKSGQELAIFTEKHQKSAKCPNLDPKPGSTWVPWKPPKNAKTGLKSSQNSSQIARAA
jgi:hypothetical protein